MWREIVKFFNYVFTNYLWLFIVICACLLALIILIVLIIVDAGKNKRKKKKAENNNQPNAPNDEAIVSEADVIESEPKADKKPKKVKKVEKAEKAEPKVKKEAKKVKEEPKKEAHIAEPVVVAEKPATEEEGEEKKGNLTGKYRLIYEKENKSWVIRKDGAGRTIRRVKTKKEALEILENMQKENEDIKIIVHKKNGKFQKKESYTRSYKYKESN